MSKLLCFGLGFSARAFARLAKDRGWHATGTSRSAAGVARLKDAGFEARIFDGEARTPEMVQAIAEATHLLISAAPDERGDPALRIHRDDIIKAPRLSWIGYLSTIGVYGDHDGAWIDETAELRPVANRALWRVAAERAWLDLRTKNRAPVQVFRLGGIYGPGRSPLDKVRAGKSRRIIKPGQVFNRIHIDDIAQVLMASCDRPRAGAIYDVTDGHPAPPQDVITYAAELLGVAPPPEVLFEEADMTPMARSFYADNKRIRAELIHEELGVKLRYPTYREGLQSAL